jgi:tetratricopeptide (TPR) repeat protein
MQMSIDLGDMGNAPVPHSYVSPQIGLIYGDLGLYDQGLEIIDRSSEHTDSPLTDTKQLATFAKAHNYLQCGNLSCARKVLGSWEIPDDELTFADLGFAVLFVSVQVRLLLESGDLERALQFSQKLSNLYHRIGFMVLLPEVLYYKGLVHLNLGDEDTAHQVLLDALEKAESIGHRRMLWQIQAALADLSPPEEAARLRAQAVGVLTYIADHTPEGELRRSFLAQPAVSSLIEDTQ